jgi:hypothetical protein
MLPTSRIYEPLSQTVVGKSICQSVFFPAADIMLTSERSSQVPTEIPSGELNTSCVNFTLTHTVDNVAA